MPTISLRLTDEEHMVLKDWAHGSHRSMQREAVFRIFEERVLSERGAIGEPQPRARPGEDGVATRTRSESTPKKRMHPCKHHLPPSKHCPYGCDG